MLKTCAVLLNVLNVLTDFYFVLVINYFATDLLLNTLEWPFYVALPIIIFFSFKLWDICRAVRLINKAQPLFNYLDGKSLDIKADVYEYPGD